MRAGVERYVPLPDGPAALVISAVTFLVYLPVLTADYGVSDDYYNLSRAAQNNSNLPEVGLAGGRAVSILMQEFALSLADTPENLRWLRLAGVLGVIASALVAAGLTRHFGASRVGQVGVGLVVAMMPSSQVIASWATMFPVSWGVALAVAVGFSIRHVTADTSRRGWVVSAAVVATFTMIGLANYQPSAMAMWVGVAAALVVDNPTIRVAVTRLAVGIVGAGVGAAAYAVLSNQLIAASGVVADSRTELSVPTGGTFRWFFTVVVPRSLDPLSFQPRTIVVWAVAIVGIVGLAALSGGRQRRIVAVTAALVAVLCSYAASIVVADRWPSARSRLPVDATVAILLGLAAIAIAQQLAMRSARLKYARVAFATVTGALVIVLCLSAADRVTTYYSEPLALELRVVRASMEGFDPDPAQPVAVIRPLWNDGFTDELDLDEFGFPSMATDWGVAGLIQIERVNNEQPLLTHLTVVPAGQPVPPEITQVLDLSSAYRVLSDR